MTAVASPLSRIDRPADLKRLTLKELDVLAEEIRGEILATISELGGHLASSLGAVELCLALHYVFDAPEDQLVWDMGYQAFAHKLITGRRGRFKTLKQFRGLSGFSNKEESPYDPFTAGHGGTALSTALGLAMARDQVNGSSHVVAIIGDASLGEGMALEALNHIGHLKPDVLVILNDNKMSIAQPVGGLSRYLNRIITNPTFNRIRADLEQLVGRLPHGSKLVRLGRKVQESVKGFLVPGLVFEELGFRYVGPIDGHNLRELTTTLTNVKRMEGPILLHVSTVKGKGYRFAEEDPERFHKIEPFDLETGQLKSASRCKPQAAGKRQKVSGLQPEACSLKPAATFTEAFSDELIRLGDTNRRLMAITAAMPEGTGVSEFAKRFPGRCLDVGMAEQHALGLAAGLARGGARPVVAIYSTFLQRAYDQIMHELCLQELPVILAIDRSSLVGEDGPTHHGVFDIAYLRVLPNIRIVSPKDPAELRVMLQWALEQDKPVAIRYARGGIVCGEPLGRPAKLLTGKSETLRSGKDLTLVALGSLVYPALKVAEALAVDGIDAAVINARFVKPLDEAMVKQAAQLGAIVTLEEAQVAGGFGSAVSETLDALGLSKTAHLRIGLPDAFVEHGRRDELLTLCQLDAERLTQRIRHWSTSLRTAADLRLLTESST
ncbi:MAG: 1-deoxy-D-xylulose-5-phosphate synthase [Candidatus Omnitrophica bacterium]|nr:1-deoxy-D-xylulose-5-phosphate synthase [Candidatus Omnitrophota bacterium]